MKRIILIALLVSGFAIMASAQGRGSDKDNPPNRPSAETVTVSGNLIVARGMPAIKSGDVTYLIGGISQLTGFVDGLKEGAQVSIEGSAMTHPRDSNVKVLRPSKLTFAGRTFDLAVPQWRPDSAGSERRFQPPSPPRQPRQSNHPQRRQQNM